MFAAWVSYYRSHVVFVTVAVDIVKKVSKGGKGKEKGRKEKERERKLGESKKERMYGRKEMKF